MKKIKIILLMCGLALWVQPVNASLTTEFVAQALSPQATGSPKPTGSLGSGVGLLLQWKLYRLLGMELGGSYLTRNYTLQHSYHLHYLSGQLGFRFALGLPIFVAAGGYANHYVSNPQSLVGKDYGAYVGVGFKVFLAPLWSFLARVDYRHALKKLTVQGDSITPHEILGSVGLSFEI